jgi:transposase
LGHCPHHGQLLVRLFHCLARSRGKQNAGMALSQSVVVILYQMLRDHRPSTDFGPDSFDQLDRQRSERHHIHRLKQLGYTVTLTTVSAT